MKHAMIKFNNGKGALLCNGCHGIIAYGFNHDDKEHYCEPCKYTEARLEVIEDKIIGIVDERYFGKVGDIMDDIRLLTF